MSFASLFSVIAPIIGLLIFLVVANVSLLQPYRRFVAPAAVGLSFLGVLFAPLESARVVILSLWQPSFFFGASPAFWVDPALWPLALGFSCAVLAGVLLQLGHIPHPRFYLGISALGVLAAGLTAVWSENLLTVLIAWAAFDMAWALGALATGLPGQRIVWGLGLNGLATMVLWVGTLAIEGGGGISWRLLGPSELGDQLLLVAGLLRIGVYPLHLALPIEEGGKLPGAAHLLLGPVLGLALLAQLAIARGEMILSLSWVEWVAMVTFLAGGLMTWTRTGGGGWPWVSVAGLGALLWAASQAGAALSVVLSGGGAVWILGVTLLRLGSGLESGAYWWSIGPLLGGLALVGMPLTAGLLPTSYLLGSLLRPPALTRVLLFFFGQVLLVAGVIRRLRRMAPPGETVGPFSQAAWAAGLALPSLAILVAGFYPRLLAPTTEAPALLRLLARPGVLGWLVWGLAIGGGVFFAAWERRFRRRLEQFLGLLYDFLRLEWLIGLLLGSLNRLTAFLGAFADVVEGPGAILWALAIFFLVLLFMVGH